MDSPEPRDNSLTKKAPAERVAEVLNDLLSRFSLPAMLGTHLAIAFSILLLEPFYQPSPPSPLVPSSVSPVLISSLKPYIALYNCFLLLTLFYCIVEQHRPQPLQLATAFNLGALWCDLLVAGSFRDVRIWILLFSILHRLFTSLILVRHWYERRRCRLMEKSRRRRSSGISFEARLRRSLEKHRNSSSLFRELTSPSLLTEFSLPRSHQLLHRSSKTSSLSKGSKGSQSTTAPSSYYSTWSFSPLGDLIRDGQKTDEKDLSSSLHSSQVNPTNSDDVTLKILYP